MPAFSFGRQMTKSLSLYREEMWTYAPHALKEDEDGIAVIVGGQCGCMSGGGRGSNHRLGQQNMLGQSAVPAGCISSLGFSQLWPVVPALFSHSLKPGGTECQRGAQRTEEEGGFVIS